MEAIEGRTSKADFRREKKAERREDAERKGDGELRKRSKDNRRCEGEEGW
jgi:hypothetical protein